MSVRTKDSDNKSVNRYQVDEVSGLLENQQVKNQEILVYDEQRAKKEQKIKESVDAYKTQSATDGVIAMENSIDANPLLSEEYGKTLDRWYESGNNVYELSALLDLSVQKNIKPSELMKKDEAYRQLVYSLGQRELISPFDDEQSKYKDEGSQLAQFNIYDAVDKGGDISLSVIAPNVNNKKVLPQTESSEAQQAKLTIDLVNKTPIDPKIVDVAKKNNFPPSIIYSDNTELKKLVDQFGSESIDTTLDTPVTFRFMQNGEFANRFRMHAKELQSIEQQLKELSEPYIRAGIRYRNKQAWLDAMHSDSVVKNLGYGISKAAVGGLGAFNWLLKKSPFTVKFGGSSVTDYIDRSMSALSDVVDQIPRDIKGMERAGEIFTDKEGGALASIGFVLSHPLLSINILSQELPASYIGGGIVGKAIPFAGKAVTMVKDVAGAGLGSFLGNLSPNVVEANQKTDDISKAVAMAERKTAIQASSDMIVSPLGHLSPTKFTSITKPINNAGQGVASYALTQYLTGEEITSKDAYLAGITGTITSLGDLNKQTLLESGTSLYRDTKSLLHDSMAYSDVVKNNPEASREIFNHFKDNTIVIPSDTFVKIMTDQGKNPYQIMSHIYGDSGAYLQRQLILGDSVSIPLGDYIVNVLNKNNLNAKLFENDIKNTRTDLTYHERQSLAEGYSSYYDTVQKTNKEKIDTVKKITQKYKEQGSSIPKEQALLEFSLGGLLNPNSFDGYMQVNKFTFDIDSSSIMSRNGSNKKSSFIQLDNNTNKITVNLTSPIDTKTFVADTSNLYIKGLLESNQNAQIIKEVSALKEYLNIDDLSQMTIKQKKQLNDELMDYLKTGKSDNVALGAVFNRYRKGVVEFYKNTNVLKPNFKQDLTQQLDRLAWTSFVIDSLSQAPYKSLFDNNSTELTANELLIYQDLQKNSSVSLQDKLYQQYNAESVKNKQQEIATFERQVYKEEAAKEEANPIYAVRDFLTKGILLDGRLGKKVKLDEADVVNHFGRKALKQLSGLTQKDGVSLEHIVNLYNIESKDVLVSGLINSVNKEKNIQRNTDQRVREKYGDSIDLKSIFMEGRNLLEHDVNRSHMLWLDNKVLLREQLKQKGEVISDAELNKLILNDSAMLKQAEIFLKQIPDGMLTQESYLGLLQQKNEKAKKAYDRGDIAQALKAKQEERLLHALYIQSKERETNRIKINNLIEKVKLSIFDLDY